MAEIRCPNCKRDNPDFLDSCQFCGTSLRSDATLHTGETPTKKNTGELEAVLPEWLRDARQQARDSAEEEAAQAATQPKIQKAEPPDLLAGLAFQASNADDEDVPDWLASINPVAKPKPAAPSSKPEPETDFFAQFNKSEPAAPKNEPAADTPSRMMGTVQQPQAPSEKDDLAAWFSQTPEQPLDSFSPEPDTSSIDAGWTPNVDTPQTYVQPSSAKEEEDLSWLHNLEAASKQTDELKTPKQDSGWMANLDVPSSSQPEQEDLSWLNNLGGISAPAPSNLNQPSDQSDDLSWLNNLGGTPVSSQPAANTAAKPQEDLSWLNDLGGVPASGSMSAKQSPEPKDDLSWLNDLGGTALPSQPAADQPSAPGDDLSWLNNLGGTTEPAPPAASQAPASQEDLSWLSNLGGTAEPVQPVTHEPAESSSDLSWLSDLGGTPAPEQPAVGQPSQSSDDLNWLNQFAATSEPASEKAAEPQNNPDWLNTLGGTSGTEQPAASQAEDDLGWLNKFASASEPEPTPAATDFSWLNEFPQNAETDASVASESISEPGQIVDDPFAAPPTLSPSQTAPLTPDAGINSMPDWLREATQKTSMPLSMDTLDQFRDDHTIKPAPDEPFSWKSFTLDAGSESAEPLPSQPESPFGTSDIFSSTVDSTPLSSQEVDSLFSMDMPDWLSQEPAKEEFPKDEFSSQQTSIHTEDAGALAPVDLPSWVQAMRPMDAAISDAGVGLDSQPAEREGPLAGLRGVIPIAPIGSSQRPKALSLKLQASDEQQAGASLLEQLLANETAPRAIPATSALTSQSVLRWVISALVLSVLGVMVGLGSQTMPVSAILPANADAVTNAINLIPDNAQVLVIMDYEPALAGEMEASSGAALAQLALLHHPTLSFVSTSPNGPALVERLMKSSRISQASPNGLGYVAGTNYFNLGYLPGGESGVLAFVQAPQTAVPASTVATLSGYAAVIVITDQAESARVWVEQIQSVKRADIMLTNQPLLILASAQAGPMLQPYVSSGQVTGLISGLAEAARYEYKNNIPLGTTRSYWDAFSVGLMMAIVLIVAGSLWSLFMGMRARRAETEQG